MPILRRVEYMIACDAPECYYAECSNWSTREEADKDAESMGWMRCSRKRWLCPKCKLKAEKAAGVCTPGTITLTRIEEPECCRTDGAPLEIEIE